MALGNSDAVVAQVLQIMVQHAEDLSTGDVARLLQLSSACRQALQQAVGCLMMQLTSANGLDAITGFAAWLPRHAGLLRELHLALAARTEDNASWAAAEQLVMFALQISSTPPGAPAAASSGPQPLSQPVPLLRLRSFTSNYVHRPAALRSLASCSHLTELMLVNVPPARFTEAFCGAIGQLRSLRVLVCCAPTVARAPFVYPSSFAAAVGQLTQLEQLSAPDRLLLADLPQLPASLTKVWLDLDHTGSSLTDLNISHLSRLLSLELGRGMQGRISAQSQLPSCLTALTLPCAADAIPGLQQLQLMHLYRPHVCLPFLRRLPRLPRLQQVSVGLEDCRQDQLEPVLAALSAGTQLTGLQLYLKNDHECQELDDEADAPGPGQNHLGDMRDILLHSYLRKLPQLQQLLVSGLALNPADVMHFTALTALTDLKIAHCRGKLDLGIAAIMQRLTGLRKLHLQGLDLSSPLIWVAAADLTNLQLWKCMKCDGIAVTDETLHLLAPLTNLTQLVLDAIENTAAGEGPGAVMGVSDTVERGLLSQLPLLDKIEWV